MRTRISVALASLASVLALAAPAHAALVDTSLCDGAALSHPFAQWGDNASYKLLPGGNFEGSLSGWSFTGSASRTSGSETFGSGAYSLKLAAGSSALSPATCVNAGNPSYRFFARSSGGLLGLLPVLNVSLVYRDGLLGLVELPLGTATPSSSWAPSPVELTLAALPAAVASGDVPLSLRFAATAGTWQVDDVYVDPYSRN